MSSAASTEKLARWNDPARRPLVWGGVLGFVWAGAMHVGFSVWAMGTGAVIVLPLIIVVLAELAARVGCAGVRMGLRRYTLGVWLGGLPFAIATHWWVSDISAAGVVPLVLYISVWLPMFAALIGMVARWTGREKIAAFVGGPIVWIGLEVVRGEFVWGGYPWYLVGQPFADSAAAVWLGSKIGMYGVGVVALGLIAGVLSIARFVRSKFETRASAREESQMGVVNWDAVTEGHILGIGCIVLFQLFGFSVNPSGDAVDTTPPARIALVQTNVPQSNRGAWSNEDRVDTMVFIDEQVASIDRGNADRLTLIIIPETMYPGYFGLTEQSYEEQMRTGISQDGFALVALRHAMLRTQREAGVPMIAGASAFENLRIGVDPQTRAIDEIDWDARTNSAFVIEGGEVRAARYDKVHLTPFGEVMPVISRWPWLEQKLLAIGAQGMSFDLSRGSAYEPVDAGRRMVATPICFEVTMSGVVRRLVVDDDGNRKAELIANLTNDGWFGGSENGRRAHLLASRWRAIELGTPLVRAANTGISAAIDAKGRVIDRLGVNEAGTLVVELRLAEVGSRATLYGRTGNVVGWACAAGMGMLLIWGVVSRRGSSRSNEEAAAA